MTAMGQDYSDLYTEKRRFTTYGWEENCAGCRGGGRKVRTRLAWIASFHRGSSVWWHGCAYLRCVPLSGWLIASVPVRLRPQHTCSTKRKAPAAADDDAAAAAAGEQAAASGSGSPAKKTKASADA